MKGLAPLCCRLAPPLNIDPGPLDIDIAAPTPLALLCNLHAPVHAERRRARRDVRRLDDRRTAQVDAESGARGAHGDPMQYLYDLIASTWRRLMTFGRRVRVIYFDRTPKVFPDTRVKRWWR